MTAWEDITGSNAVPSSQSAFDHWYAHYPRKVARGAAEKAFAKALKQASLEQLIAGAQRYAAAMASQGTAKVYIAHPASWLNQKRWLDELEAAAQAQPASSADASLRRVDLLLTRGIRSQYLDARDIRLALRLGRMTVEDARKHGFGWVCDD